MTTFFLENEEATVAFGKLLGKVAESLHVIYLEGDLGAGKTTLVRGLVASLGHRGFVKSPTFTIVEPYLDTVKPIYHFDLYRLQDPEELEFLGIRDYVDHKHLCIFEWPDHGGAYVPAPDLLIRLTFERDGRTVMCQPKSAMGEVACERLQHLWQVKV